jgi:glycosyltransferase involved in cell wall biosynthesis
MSAGKLYLSTPKDHVMPPNGLPITLVTKVVPMETGSGSSIRVEATLRALASRRPVHVVFVTNPGHDLAVEQLTALKTRGINVTTISEEDLAVAGRWRRLVADLIAIASPRLANRLLPKFDHAMIDEPNGDLWMFKTTLLAGRRIPNTGRVIVDLDDLEERTLRTPRTISQLHGRVHLVSQRRRSLGIARTSLVCSDLDRKRLHRHTNVDILPNTYLGADASMVIAVQPKEPIVAMVGRMQYPPNREGAEWFATKCWPLFRAQIPNIRCQLMGDGAEVLEQHAKGGIEIVDGIDDPIKHLREVAVIIAPILRGSGTRVKILEAMALGIPVVSTTIGAEGLHVTDGNDILLRDTPSAFASGVAQLLADPRLADDIGQKGKKLFDAHYRFDRFQEHVDRVLRNIA